VTPKPLAGLAARVRSGEPLYIGWCGSTDPSVPEAMLAAGFESVLLDMQHGTLDFAAAARSVAHMAAMGRPAFVRIPVDDFATASKLLDAGAGAIVAPMINSVEDARRFVGFCKFPPVGERSWGPGRALAWSGLDPAAYFAGANDLHLALAMIETRRALDALDDILGVPGLDGVLIGPSDLSIGLSDGAIVDAHHKIVDDALDRIAATCRKQGKLAALFCMTGPRAGEMAARGFQICLVSTDGALIRMGATLELDAARRECAARSSCLR
jgi:4-hydroxy-2-oxoheptanedioate aldolase